MKFLKKIIVATLLLGLICCPLKASAISYASIVTDSKQQEIDALFTALNKLAAEKRMLSAMDQYDVSLATTNSTQRLEAINNCQADILNQLEKLGVHTIDPNNSADMAQLAEVVLGKTKANSTAAIPDPPDLEELADCYTVSQYQSSTRVDGVEYNYICIYITDNKGYSRSPLTSSEVTINLIGKESAVLGDLLDYQFSFALSSYLGQIPYGWAVDWTIGSVFTALNSMNENSTISYTNNKSIYTMSMLSVTQMMYCYVYIPNADWELCGVRAPNVEYARTETFVSNIGGSAFSDAENYPTVTSNTGRSTASYVANMIRGNQCIFDRIGTFSVNTYNGASVRFRPGFAEYPSALI